MKAARLREYGQALQLEEVPAPELSGHHDVIVRIGGAGVCRTDLHIIDGMLRGLTEVELPYTLGHENAGWVEAVGDAVRSVRAGDAVIVHPAMTCGVCAGCQRGEDMYCTNQQMPGFTTDGGFAEYLRTNERALVALPESLLPAEVAPFADAGLAAYRAAKKAARELRAGDTVAVIGVGGLGHIAVQVLHALAPATVLALDRSQPALSLARDLGVEHVIAAGADAVEAVRELSGGGVNAVLDFVGEQDTPAQAIAMLAQGGSYYVIGYGGQLNVPLADLLAREISIITNLVGNHTELEELIALAATQRVRLETQEYRLDQINEAFAALRQGNLRGRAVITPS
jgi:NAD+-dependent secondary alcohol dehydrogenase Adh1